MLNNMCEFLGRAVKSSIIERNRKSKITKAHLWKQQQQHLRYLRGKQRHRRLRFCGWSCVCQLRNTLFLATYVHFKCLLRTRGCDSQEAKSSEKRLAATRPHGSPLVWFV